MAAISSTYWHRGMHEVTRILNAIDEGDPVAAEKLLPLVYDELRKLAADRLAQEEPGNTLQPTALVHEAYLRLVGASDSQSWDSRGHFFAAAAEAMRRILIDGARRRSRFKRGGQRNRVELDEECTVALTDSDDLLALDEALSRFAVEEPVKAKLVMLRYFGGLSIEQAAAALEISTATAKRYWSYSRAWLYEAVAGDTSTG
jgi:RNA polymerase sigma factor (TIGR02999 family)